MATKSNCKCIIRGIVQIGIKKGNDVILTQSIEYPKFLRKFEYCPLCGKRIK